MLIRLFTGITIIFSVGLLGFSADTVYIVDAGTLNIRSGAGTQYHVIGKLTKNDTIRKLQYGIKWSQFTFHEKKAFIYSKYLRLHIGA